MRKDVCDPATGIVRLCASQCSTCIFRPGNPMALEPGALKDLIGKARRNQGHIVCHATLDTDDPAICRGYADHADHGRSLALRLATALGTVRHITPPTLKPES